MTRSPLALAALASAAVPGLEPVSVTPTQVEGIDFDVAVVTDDQARRWVIRAPRRTAAAVIVDAEARLLPALAPLMPVAVPQPAGHSNLPEGGRCAVHAFLPGTPLDVERMRPGSLLAAQLGQVIGSLHDIDPDVLDDAGAPVYSADEYRLRRLSDVDRAAATGHVPASLLTRWEHELERVTHWRFASTPVHGDLAGEHVLVDADRVSAIIDWGEARVADPADDLAWICLGASSQVLDTVVEAYAMARSEPPDRHLLDRAHLAGELAFARWLLAGTAADDASIVDSATRALLDLSERVGTSDPVGRDA